MIATIVSNRFSHQKLIIAVSAKFFKKAAIRNLLKRRTRAILHPFLKDLKAPVLVRLAPGASQAAFSDLAEILKKEIKNYLR